MAIYLDTRKYVILKKIIFIGTVNGSSIFLRDVFREGVKCNATSFILIHNHPSLSINPSLEDLYLTSSFIKMGKIMDMELVDHLIIGKDEYYSIRERNSDLFAKNN